MTHQAIRPTIATRFSSLAVKVMATLGLGLALPAIAAEQPLTGADIGRAITAVLSRHKITGSPQINPAEIHNPCPGGVTVAPLFSNWKTVKVTCPQDPQWRHLVRVELDQPRGKIATQSPKNRKIKSADKPGSLTALALNRSVVKGEMIMAEDVIEVSISAQQNYGVFHSADDVIGRQVRTPITAKNPIKSRQLEPRYLVEEKKPVLIAYSLNGIYVEMSGISLQNGQSGETVKVENLSSGKTIIGKVIGLRKISPMH